MADLREPIMVRLLAILTGLSGIETVARNLDVLDDLKLPAAILYDGDEEAFDNQRATGAAGNAINALPQIVVSFSDVPENVGTTANAWLAKVKRAVLLDSALAALCAGLPLSGARYLNCDSSLTPGRASEVALIIHFNVTYPMNPKLL